MTYKPQIKNLIELQTVGSTNDHARTLARNGYPDASVVWAHEQTAGRGRQGNKWTSPVGNLYMSVILRPQKSAAITGQMSFVTALAVADAVRECVPTDTHVAVKWPNDILVDGKKCAGILLETESNGVNAVGFLVIGIGVNVVSAPEDAVHLNMWGGDTVSGQVLEKIHARLLHYYTVWNRDGFASIREQWVAQAHNLGQTINVRLPRETFSATFIGIDNSGALEVELPDGTRRDIASGEVFAA